MLRGGHTLPKDILHLESKAAEVVQISLDTGGRIDKDLCGDLCTTAPKQRVHQVIDDSEHLW